MMDDDRDLLTNPMVWWTEYAARNAHQPWTFKADGELLPNWLYFNIDIALLLPLLIFGVAKLF